MTPFGVRQPVHSQEILRTPKLSRRGGKELGKKGLYELGYFWRGLGGTMMYDDA